MRFEAGTCKFCRQSFVRERKGVGGKPMCYCDDECRKRYDAQRQRRSRKRRERTAGKRLAEREPVCYCGAELAGVGFDTLGRTVEMCAKGHETLALIRRTA